MGTRKFDIKGEMEYEITTVTSTTVGCREKNGTRKTEMFFQEEFSPMDKEKVVLGSTFKQVHGYYEEDGQKIRFSTLIFNGSPWSRTKKLKTEKVPAAV